MTAQTLTLTEFLLARIAEDEEVAREADEGNLVRRYARMAPGPIADHFVRHHPARVLAECEAKRRIVELHEVQRQRRDAYRSPRSRAIEDEKATTDRRTQEARSRAAEDAVLALAAVYRDHPDYRPEWRPV